MKIAFAGAVIADAEEQAYIWVTTKMAQVIILEIIERVTKGSIK